MILQVNHQQRILQKITTEQNCIANVIFQKISLQYSSVHIVGIVLVSYLLAHLVKKDLATLLTYTKAYGDFIFLKNHIILPHTYLSLENQL